MYDASGTLWFFALSVVSLSVAIVFAGRWGGDDARAGELWRIQRPILSSIAAAGSVVYGLMIVEVIDRLLSWGRFYPGYMGDRLLPLALNLIPLTLGFLFPVLLTYRICFELALMVERKRGG